ncbi:unnamed protein product [Prunus armeniaca]
MNAVGNGKSIDHKGKLENTILPQLARRLFSYKSDVGISHVSWLNPYATIKRRGMIKVPSH